MDDNKWYKCREILGDEIVMISSGHEGVVVGTDNFKTIVPTKFSNDDVRIAVLPSHKFKEVKEYFNEFAFLEGTIKIYKFVVSVLDIFEPCYDVALTIEGSYFVFYYENLVVFVE